MLVSIAEKHPAWRSDLVRRLENHEFDKVILFYVPASAPSWYAQIIRAIERSYRPEEHVDGYWLYVPK